MRYICTFCDSRDRAKRTTNLKLIFLESKVYIYQLTVYISVSHRCETTVLVLFHEASNIVNNFLLHVERTAPATISILVDFAH